ncbi:MAG: phosphoribosylanthranilate isomerase [Desulfarculus sp.]|nr:MAG: phosphoribosylanthranilate isomerase [Desulfarculus sp.]
MVLVKICGLTTVEDALAAARLGADMLGLVFAASPRQVTPLRAREIVRALPRWVQAVGVFVDAPRQEVQRVRAFCGLHLVQLHGRESADDVAALGPGVIKAIRMGEDAELNHRAYPRATLLLDAYAPGRPGGTGRSFDWSRAIDLARRRPVILAGGLNPANVAPAVEIVKPYAVDVSSGVESQPGRKDHDQIASFIARAKGLVVPA